MKIELTSNITRVIGRIDRFSKKSGIRQIIAQSINATRSEVRRLAVGRVAKHTGHTQPAISKRTTIRGKASKTRLGGVELRMKTSPIAVHTLSKSISKEAIGAKVGRKTFPGTFPGKIPKSSTVGVWRRLGKPRHPIELVRVPFGDGVQPIAKQAVKEKFEPEFKLQFEKRFKKRKRKFLKGLV